MDFMKRFSCLLLLLAAPTCALGQDFHKGGFFDADVSQTGFFTDDQAGIPIKNDTGTTTTRTKSDTWEVSPDSIAGIEAAKAEIVARGHASKEQGSSGDSFEVKKEQTN